MCSSALHPARPPDIATGRTTGFHVESDAAGFAVPRSVGIYCLRRIDGVNVMPTNNPSGSRNRLTVCPHGSVLFFTSIR